MQNIITENDYPVESSWILKIPVNFLIIALSIAISLGLILLPIGILTKEDNLTFLVIMGILAFTLMGIGFLSTIIAALSRDNFHYSIENEFMIFHQGIISKQQKNLPYSVIQDLIVTQDIADKLLGLASITIENASFGGGQVYAKGRQAKALIGFIGNVVVIPGLTTQNAIDLRKILLSKIREYKSLDRRSGL
jgi:uncharacterized membrane protein YdbT with pleckstrin-like domain